MQRPSQIASIINKRRPLSQKIENVEANLRSLATTLRHLERYRDELANKVDPGTASRLREIDCSTIQRGIDSELVSLNNLRSRFSRDTLNIGVVGRARQGKSRLLQSLTGLTTSEIPDGDHQHCTGVRSTIYHISTPETHAEVWFHSERSFLDEVIAPYYHELQLGSRPTSIQEFADSPLPSIPSNLSTQAVSQAKYEHLRRYYQYLDKYRDALFENSPRRIVQEQIREYVAQDTLDGHRIYFNYLAVREVKIFCPFPNQDIGQVALIDMPGLGDTGIGDAERMIKTLGRDIDVVLFVRMPKAMGDYWGTEDVALYDMANSALVELPLKEWSFMVLNHISHASGKDDNQKNCQNLAESRTEKHLEVVDCMIANCADTEEANARILDPVLEYLTHRIDVLDRQYASSCQDRVNQLQKMLKVELDKAHSAWESTTRDEWFPEFLGLFKDLWTDLAVGLESLLSTMIVTRDTDDQNFKSSVDATIQQCRNDTGIPSLSEIEIRAKKEGSYDIAYAQYLHKVRTYLSKRFLSLDTALHASLEDAKSQVVEVLIQKGKLGNLAEGEGSNVLKALAERIPEKLERLRLGFQTLATFDLQYRGLIQHRIRKHLDVLDPDRTPFRHTGTRIGGAKKPTAEGIEKSLKLAQTQAVNNCEKELKILLKEPNQAGFAIVEEFVDQVLRAEDVDQDWQKFLNEFAADVWPNEFDSTIRLSHFRGDWLKTIKQVVNTSSPETMNFSN
ncbi:MAG: hypothetical protein MUF49_28295 [Oculatellaceae cyanobacterium Prado106]|jgi:chaperonin cofactor prefoldin|nr:hypothetical protein [Oculatellaceae cyanobacterium Prado106]